LRRAFGRAFLSFFCVRALLTQQGSGHRAPCPLVSRGSCRDRHRITRAPLLGVKWVFIPARALGNNRAN
jgi:hypothetical protein